MNKDMCFADAANHFQPIDLIVDGLSQCYKQTYEQILERYPHAVIMPFDEAYDKYVDSAVTSPKEITKEDFWYFLEVFPPCSWQRQHDSESFYMSEFTNGNVTKHLVRVGERYFSFEDHVMRSHEDRVKKVL